VTPVSVVIPCHNYGRYVADALRSIAEQTELPDEVLVINDGSTDDSSDVLDTCRRELADRLPITVVNQANQGLVRTLNDGVRRAASPYVMFVSADDRARPELIARLRRKLDHDPRAGYAYSKMELFGDESGVYLTYPFSPGRLIFDHNYVPGAAMVRRDAYLQVGGLRELPAEEDWDMWLAFLAAGWRGQFEPTVQYEWRRHGEARNHQSQATRLRLRVQIQGRRPLLLLRYAHLAIPYTVTAFWRRLRLRVGPSPRYARTASGCWIEAPVTEDR